MKRLAAHGGAVSSFALYLLGLIVFIGGLAYGAHLAGLQQHWIIVGGRHRDGLGHHLRCITHSLEGPAGLEPDRLSV